MLRFDHTVYKLKSVAKFTQSPVLCFTCGLVEPGYFYCSKFLTAHKLGRPY